MFREKLTARLSALSIRQRILFAYIPNIALIVFIAMIANRKQIEIADFAAVKEAQQVAQTIEYFITDTPLVGEDVEENLSENGALIQPYVERLHKQLKRDFEIVDRNGVIVADVATDDIGTVFADDVNGEVQQTMLDGVPRTFTEISDDYPQGVLLIAIPLDLDSGEIVGAMILEYTPLRDEILTFASESRRLVGLFGLASIALVLGIGVTVPGRINALVNRLSGAVVAVVEGRWKPGTELQLEAEMSGLREPFNRMTNAIQERDTKLQEAARQLEQRITETQAALTRAEQSDRVKSAFLASMSHELRTPLNSIINFSKFVAKGTMGPVTEKQVTTLNKVIDSGKHLLNLINDVLDMSRIESGSLTLYVEEQVALKEILDNACATASGLLEGKPVDLKLNVAPDLPTLTGDRQRIYQILLNLLSNACKFTEEGDITLSAWREDGQVHISVRDTGPGIAPEDFEAVFTAFRQTGTGLRQGTGTGLGMPISKSLVEAHGGRLWFESVVDQGTCFHFTLPVEAPVLTPAVMA